MSDNKPIIMVVDDQPDFVDGVKLILEEEGYNVWTATNGQHALDRLEAALERRREQGSIYNHARYLPDLILADIMMPVMNGHDFYEQVRDNPFLTHIPFIFLTAKTDPPDIREGKRQGADDYLTKPCPSEDLLASVQGKLRRRKKWDELMRVITGNPATPTVVGIVIITAIIIFIIVVTALITLWIAK